MITRFTIRPGTFPQKHVDDLAELVQRAHRHGIAYGIGLQSSKLIDPLLILHSIWICLNHGRMIEFFCNTGIKVEIILQIILDAEIQRPLH